MPEDDIRKWSREAYRELKRLEYQKHRILDRCCRATLDGAVEIRTYEDKVLMKEYKPKLNYCPECGRKLPEA